MPFVYQILFLLFACGLAFLFHVLCSFPLFMGHVICITSLELLLSVPIEAALCLGYFSLLKFFPFYGEWLNFYANFTVHTASHHSLISSCFWTSSSHPMWAAFTFCAIFPPPLLMVSSFSKVNPPFLFDSVFFSGLLLLLMKFSVSFLLLSLFQVHCWSFYFAFITSSIESLLFSGLVYCSQNILSFSVICTYSMVLKESTIYVTKKSYVSLINIFIRAESYT